MAQENTADIEEVVKDLDARGYTFISLNFKILFQDFLRFLENNYEKLYLFGLWYSGYTIAYTVQSIQYRP